MSDFLSKNLKVPSNIRLSVINNTLYVKGPLGTTLVHVPKNVYVRLGEGSINLEVSESSLKPKGLRTYKACLGALTANLRQSFTGVLSGHRSQLNLVGVGFKASVSGGVLSLKLGYSHDVLIPVPDSILVKCSKPTTLLFKSCSAAALENFVSRVQSCRPPEPYKGKGVLRRNQTIIRKEGKRG